MATYVPGHGEGATFLIDVSLRSQVSAGSASGSPPMHGAGPGGGAEPKVPVRDRPSTIEGRDNAILNVRQVPFVSPDRLSHASGPSRRSVTRAAIGLRSLRVSVTWAKSGCP